MILEIKGTNALNSRVHSFDTLLAKLFDLYVTKLKTAVTVAAITALTDTVAQRDIARYPVGQIWLHLRYLAYRRQATHIIRFIERLLNGEIESSTFVSVIRLKVFYPRTCFFYVPPATPPVT